MCKMFFLKCKECWERLARWYCNGRDITKEELKQEKIELLIYIFAFLFGLCAICVLQVAGAQEVFTLTLEEMGELESLLDSLKSENKQLTKRSEGLTSLAERLKGALERRDESLNALQSSYDEFESEAKKAMSEMSAKIIEQDLRIAGLKKKVIILIGIIVVMLLAILIYFLLKVNWKQLTVGKFFQSS